MREVIQLLSTNSEFGSEFTTSDDFWEKLCETIEVLQIPFVVTKTMQHNGFGLADFYISWIRMKRGLSRLSNGQLNLSHRLIEALEENLFC